jgi:hypothetical protein
MPTADKDQKKIIILRELRSYCVKNSVSKIGYSKLRELSNSFLDSYSGGFQTNMGGNFDKLITELQSQGLLERKRTSPKRTFIVPSIPKIDEYFRKNDLKRSLDEMNNITGLIPKNSFDEGDNYSFDTKQKRRYIAESAPTSEMLQMKVTRRKLRDFLKKDVEPGLSATLVDISFAGDASAETIKHKITKRLLELTQQIISQNNVSSQFMLILRYAGIPCSQDELGRSERFSNFYRRLGVYFVEWAEHFEMYELIQRDKASLNEGKIEELSKDGRGKLKIFLRDLIDNFAKDQVSISIISEIYKKILSDDED